ncbi:hypothetical protein [Litoribacillus peritrichatus]|uniref:Tryptophan synthase subunit beta like protein n=1 Tax=Litoribacillus peritrichatus TaxID=718191 RepID=A0ABP7MG82_9GAMM
MPYIERSDCGKIVALHSESHHDGAEYLPSTHHEVIAFLDADCDQSEARQALKDSDAELARVAEDLIQVLVQKQVILFTDLPDAVQEKLVARQKLRSLLSTEDTSILSDDDMI